MSTFGKRLDIALAMAKMRPIDLCKKTGISQSAISNYRNDFCKPKLDRVAIIADALNVSPSWLIGYELDPVSFAELFETLSDEHQEDVVEYMRFLKSKEKEDV